jgi:pSer/pThr/pTyr-binding forkhead associated (FHA) protein
VPDQLLTILKFCLLALVYLFFLRVLRAVWAEITPPKVRGGGRGRAGAAAPVPARAAAPVAAAAAPARGGRRRGRSKDDGPGQLVVVEPAALQGRTFPVTGQVTIGRAANCQITVDDTFVSQMHARVYPHDGQVVVEDLGSTNGTYLNRNRLSGAMIMQRGDRLQIGNTVLELA